MLNMCQDDDKHQLDKSLINSALNYPPEQRRVQRGVPQTGTFLREESMSGV